MKLITKVLFIAVFVPIISSPLQAQTTKQEKELRGEILTKKGKTVQLFHSGTNDVKKIFCVGDILPVYREVYAYGVIKKTEVGKIKVISFVGDHNIVAEVLDGKIKNGDVVQKESAYCLIHPSPEEE